MPNIASNEAIIAQVKEVELQTLKETSTFYNKLKENLGANGIAKNDIKEYNHAIKNIDKILSNIDKARSNIDKGVSFDRYDALISDNAKLIIAKEIDPDKKYNSQDFKTLSKELEAPAKVWGDVAKLKNDDEQSKGFKKLINNIKSFGIAVKKTFVNDKKLPDIFEQVKTERAGQKKNDAQNDFRFQIKNKVEINEQELNSLFKKFQEDHEITIDPKLSMDKKIVQLNTQIKEMHKHLDVQIETDLPNAIKETQTTLKAAQENYDNAIKNPHTTIEQKTKLKTLVMQDQLMLKGINDVMENSLQAKTALTIDDKKVSQVISIYNKQKTLSAAKQIGAQLSSIQPKERTNINPQSRNRNSQGR